MSSNESKITEGVVRKMNLVLEWLGQFKDEEGDWKYDHKLFKEVMAAFPSLNPKNACEESELGSDAEGSYQEEESEDEEGDISKDEKEKEKQHFAFMEKVDDFIEMAKEFMFARQSTLVDRNRPYRASKPNYWYYEEFRKYLEEQNFIENMINVLVKMFSLHPELPEDPLEFIRSNFGTSKEEEEQLIAEWMDVSKEMMELKEEGKLLEKRIDYHMDGQASVETIDEEQEKLSLISQKIRARQREAIAVPKKPSLTKSDDEMSSMTRESSYSFTWTDDFPSTRPSRPGSPQRMPKDSDDVASNTAEGYKPIESSDIDAEHVAEFKPKYESSSSVDFDATTEE